MSSIGVLTLALAGNEVFHEVNRDRFLRGQVGAYFHSQKVEDFSFTLELSRELWSCYIVLVLCKVPLES